MTLDMTEEEYLAAFKKYVEAEEAAERSIEGPLTAERFKELVAELNKIARESRSARKVRSKL